MKKDNFDKGVGALLQAFPERRIDCGIFWTFLNDLSDEEFLMGIAKIISTRQEIYPNTNLIALVREGAKVSNKELPGEAWAAVLEAVRSVGSYGIPKFTPLIQRAVECIGWRNICLSENIGVERAHFLKIYESLAVREKENEMLTNNAVKELIHATAKEMK